MSTGPTPDVAEQVAPARPRGAATWGWPRTVAVILGIALAGAVLLGGAGAGLVVAVVSQREPGIRADGTVEGLETFTSLTNLHVDTPVDYEQRPPVGGDHLSVWQDCGFYDGAIIPEAAVHSLEHGAVWVTYDPDLPAAQVRRLQELAEVNAYLLVSPMRGLPAPVVASAWGVQVRLSGAEDVRLPVFVTTYQQGPQNPEPGAPCSGGLSGTVAQLSGV